MKRTSRDGLVLLVVLGMLALFSLLTVTYVVFASQSKSSNVAMSRRYIHESSASTKPLFEEAIKQLIRGTKDSGSALWGSDLLGDLYGPNETESLNEGSLVVRSFQAVSGAQMTHISDCLERPMLLGSEFSTPYLPGRFLRIPIAYRNKTSGVINLSDLPQNDDLLTGRLVTFDTNQGPLAGQTFRIHRYIGDHRGDSDQFLRASSYSIVIDLAETNLAKQHNQFVSTGAGNRRSITGTLADWVLLYPPITGYDKWACGVYLCYGEVVESPLLPNLSQGYELFLNAAPINSHGISVGADGATQFHELVAPGTGYAMPDPDINYMPAGFQLNTQLARVITAANNPSGSFRNPDGSRTNVFVGDADEPVDAADLDTLFMSYTEPGVTSSGDIIPSFHRAHLINYIVNWKDFNSYTELDFWATIRRIQLAMKRPLAMYIVTPNGTPAFMGTTASPYSINANFDAPGIKPLVINSTNNWGIYWSTTGRFIFKTWLDQLTAGTWDVDNDGDGVNDSVWTNIGLPLQRTADGKLLMALVAYHIEDLDGKIDINAAGGTAQANNYVFSNGLGSGLFTRPESSPVPNGFKTESVFAKGVVARSASGTIIGGPTPNLMVSQYFDQGQGVGPADIGFRHLLSKNNLMWVSRNTLDGSPILISGVPQVTSGFEGSEQAYAFIMAERYKPNSNSFDFNWAPGGLGVSSGTSPSFLLGDAANRSHFISQFLLRPDLLNHQGSHHHTEGLTGLPVGIRGRVSVGLDRLGNPAIHNDDKVMTANNNEYEARWISSPFQDSPFTLDEFEPIYRNHDSDMAVSSNRMKAAFGETTSTLPSSSLKHEITPISRSLRAPRLGARATSFAQVPAASYFELVRNLQELKQHPTTSQVSYDTFKQLFPLEFIRNESFNINRPFGNGVLEGPVGYDVDEPAELTSFNQRAIEATATYQVTTHPFNVDSLATADTTGLDIGSGMETRQLFARNLYSIAQLLVPDDYAFPNVDRTYWQSLCQTAYSNTSTDDSKAVARQKMIKLRARVLAQWAVNIVDFRDSDGAMTRFAYDEDPFRRLNVFLNRFRNAAGDVVGYQNDTMRTETSGWTVSTGAVAWGMEQPEALLTESIALHDTKIRKDEIAPSDRYDQFRMPQGSLFLEIYNPRSTAAVDETVLPAIPKSLYTNSGGEAALNLSKLSPANSTGQVFPVWRVYISGSVNKAAQTQTLKTPNERLKATVAAGASKFDLTYQLPTSNILDPTLTLDWTNVSAVNTRADAVRASAGLIFDHADTAQQLPDPSPTQSRVILFTRDANFVPTLANTPGVASAQQVFYNRNTTDVMLKGNQYLTIGPRITTYLGSRTSSRSSEGGRPGNQPSRHRITLSNNDWIYAYDDAGAQYRDLTTRVRSPLAMVAAAPIPTSSDWTNPPSNAEATFTQIGISVSEPLPIDRYYDRPLKRANSNNTTADTTAPGGITPTNAPGFASASIEADAYFDYQTPGAPAKAPLDNPATTQGPLRNWDINADGVPDTQSGVTQSVVAQGTVNDWCTAYLQRLADPNKAFDTTLNPYITVDWIPIDLTVFHGEETLSGPVRLASRQKLGSSIVPQTLAFDTTTGGKSFLTTLTNDPPSSAAGGVDNFLRFRLEADQGSYAMSPRPTLASGTNSFMTLGYLNSSFVLAAESPILAQIPDLPAPYVGAPADPTHTNPQWHPATVFWANRPYINSFELAYVPVSAPAQLGQEFSAQFGGTAANYYAASYTNTDPRMPTSPYSEYIRNDVAPNGVPDPAFTGLNLPGRSTAGVNNSSLAYPFGHLLNFFQEMPDLRTPYAHLSRNAPTYDAYTQQHAKDTSLAQMLDWVDTLSPWADVENLQSPNLFQQRTFDPANDYGRLIATNNIIFAPYRAPYNNMSRRVEPGKINVNSIKSQNVWHGLLYNTLEPTDIDFSPIAPSSPFAEANGDIDYNRNGVNDGAVNGGDPERPERIYPGAANTKMAQLYNNFLALRRGYAGPVHGAYVPPSSLVYHKDIPSMFGGAFMPATEYGMKPVTRLNASYGSVPAKYQPPNVPPSIPLSTGSPASVTLMRKSISTNEPALTADAPNSLDKSLGPMDKANAYTHFYPISRLQKLTTERSNAFAVYTTIGLFEVDSAGDIGKEYGIDSGEARRFKAFYIIDRSAPVGYRIGEDHNTESTILIRRILAE